MGPADSGQRAQSLRGEATRKLQEGQRWVMSPESPGHCGLRNPHRAGGTPLAGPLVPPQLRSARMPGRCRAVLRVELAGRMGGRPGWAGSPGPWSVSQQMLAKHPLRPRQGHIPMPRLGGIQAWGNWEGLGGRTPGLGRATVWSACSGQLRGVRECRPGWPTTSPVSLHQLP